MTLDGALLGVPSDLIGAARLVNSYANAKVMRTDILRQVEITEVPDEQD